MAMPEYPETVNYPSTPEQYDHHYAAEDKSRPRHYTVKPFPHPDHPTAHEVRSEGFRLKYGTLEQAQYVANALNQWAGSEI